MQKVLFVLLLFFLFSGCTQQQVSQQPINISSVNVSFIVNDGTENILEKTIEIEKGTIALEALRQATLVEGKQYEFGFFIESIAGVNSGQSHYWAIYVDKVYAEKGIDQIVIDKDTNMRFVLEQIREF